MKHPGHAPGIVEDKLRLDGRCSSDATTNLSSFARSSRAAVTRTWSLPQIPHAEPNFRKLAGLDGK